MSESRDILSQLFQAADNISTGSHNAERAISYITMYKGSYPQFQHQIERIEKAIKLAGDARILLEMASDNLWQEK